MMQQHALLNRSGPTMTGRTDGPGGGRLWQQRPVVGFPRWARGWRRWREIDKQKAIINDVNAKKEEVEKAKGALDSKLVGFCVGGHAHPNSRTPQAYAMIINADAVAAPVPT